MKPIKLSITLCFCLFLLTSCFKTEHRIRIKSSYPSTITGVAIGGTSYGFVSFGETTDYKVVDEGSNTLRGTASNGGVLTGSVVVEGRGKHDWTMTILGTGTLDLVEDE